MCIDESKCVQDNMNISIYSRPTHARYSSNIHNCCRENTYYTSQVPYTSEKSIIICGHSIAECYVILIYFLSVSL